MFMFQKTKICCFEEKSLEDFLHPNVTERIKVTFCFVGLNLSAFGFTEKRLTFLLWQFLQSDQVQRSGSPVWPHLKRRSFCQSLSATKTPTTRVFIHQAETQVTCFSTKPDAFQGSFTLNFVFCFSKIRLDRFTFSEFSASFHPESFRHTSFTNNRKLSSQGTIM